MENIREVEWISFFDIVNNLIREQEWLKVRLSMGRKLVHQRILQARPQFNSWQRNSNCV